MRYYFVATTIEIIPPFQDVPIHPNKVCSIECRMRTKLLLIAEPTSLTELEAHLTAAALPLHSLEPFGLSGGARERGREAGVVVIVFQFGDCLVSAERVRLTQRIRDLLQGSRYFFGQRFCVLCFEICTPFLLPLSPFCGASFKTKLALNL